MVAGTGLDYIRLGTSVNPEAVPWSGGFTPVRRGSDRAMTAIAVGPSLWPTLEATADLDATVLYGSTVRPFDTGTLREMLASPVVVLVEPYLAWTSSTEVANVLWDVPHRLLALGVDRVEHRHYGGSSEHD